MSKGFESYRMAREAKARARLDMAVETGHEVDEAITEAGVENPIGNLSDRRGVGEEAMLFASIEQKLLDCKGLVDAKMIVNGACTRSWPLDAKGKPKVFLGDYSNIANVNELLQWVYGEDGFADCLDYLGSSLNPDTLLAQVGMPSRAGRAGRAA